MNRLQAVTLLVLTSILWSFGGVFIKLIPWSPLVIAGLRSIISAGVFFIFLKGKVRKPNQKVILGAIAYTATLILYVTATKTTTAANAILLQYTAPIWLLLISHFFLKESIRKYDVLSIIAVFIGISIFFTANIGIGQMFGNLLAILSGICMALMILCLKHSADQDEMQIIFWGNMLTFFTCLPFMQHIEVTKLSIGAILFLGIFQLGISYILYAKAIKHVSAIDAVLIPIIEPLFNPVWVMLFVHEIPSSQAIMGGIIVVFAIVSRNIYLTRAAKKQLAL
ncbi:DMT family transporter [Fusibacter sp. 3D3]|uniref:DMT family transporter n=1 Tax=Fusibacter sp. 3D3 TaxID=1048380 RepID=UPI000853A7FB|nr:DMT family transporter [Fusibacter sp. 3D3]GAU77279.1 membrane protein [Fusibacter sp. 3D3]